MSETEDSTFPIGGNAAPVLRAFAERIERLDEERKALVDDIKEVFDEAKSAGFDAKILRKVLARRKMDPKDRKEMDELIALYEETLA